MKAVPSEEILRPLSQNHLRTDQWPFFIESFISIPNHFFFFLQTHKKSRSFFLTLSVPYFRLGMKEKGKKRKKERKEEKYGGENVTIFVVSFWMYEKNTFTFQTSIPLFVLGNLSSFSLPLILSHFLFLPPSLSLSNGRIFDSINFFDRLSSQELHSIQSVSQDQLY